MLHSSPSRHAVLRVTRPELALIAITALWGATFLIVHDAMRYSGPQFFVGVRFVTAGIFAAVLFRKSLRGMRPLELGAGAVIGVMIFFGYGLQTFGLQSISSSESAFITAFYVPLVPLLQLVFLRKRPHRMAVLGIVLAFVGLLLLAGPSAWRIGLGPGETATLLSTLAIAGEIILISRFAGRVDLARVTVVQLFVGGLLAFASMPLTREAVPAFSWAWLVPAAGLGIASAIIQLTMNWAQQSVSPTRATVIYAAEPVWAGIVGAVAGDRLPGAAIVGAVLIVAGVIVSELRLPGSDPEAVERPVDSERLPL